MENEYLTIAKQAVSEYEEKRSRFIATVKPVSTEEEAVDFINFIRGKYWDASHNVYSYYIGGNNVIQKFSDDGEPPGTAGLPVLEVIKRMGVRDLAVVVTRYFGGTLLGAAGLVRAYSRSAAQAIEAAGIIRKKLCVEMTISVEYSFFGKLQGLIAARGYAVKSELFAENVEVVVMVPCDEAEGFASVISEASNARAAFRFGDKTFATFGDG